MTTLFTRIAVAGALLSVILGSLAAEACSRILWDTALGTYVGRGEDWYEDAPEDLWVLPRGMVRDGLAGEGSYKWKSKYGSLVVVMNNHIAMDGINECGFSAHILWLSGTKVAPRDPKRPGLAMSLWMQWYLDSFATVKEAVDASQNMPFQLRMAMDEHGMTSMFHIAVEDAGGDSAIFEMIDGKLKIYHDRRYVVMTNQPTYDKQLEILSQYAGFGGSKPLPGTHDPSDRFIRGAFYAKNLPAPQSERDAIAALMSVMRNVGQPFGLPSPERQAFAEGAVSHTVFRTIMNLDKRILYFDRVMSPTVFWVRLEGLDFSEGTPTKKLSTADNALALDATDKFQPAEMFEFISGTEKTLGADEPSGRPADNPHPAASLQWLTSIIRLSTSGRLRPCCGRCRGPASRTAAPPHWRSVRKTTTSSPSRVPPHQRWKRSRRTVPRTTLWPTRTSRKNRWYWNFHPPDRTAACMVKW